MPKGVATGTGSSLYVIPQPKHRERPTAGASEKCLRTERLDSFLVLAPGDRVVLSRGLCPVVTSLVHCDGNQRRISAEPGITMHG